ncbi:MAG: response regulator [Anaerolineales bacterium]|nr:response regulator [Anaerolineales bacterium]
MVQKHNSTRKSTILIVDDDRAILEILDAALRPEGYNLALASNGRKALELLQDLSPDLILLDVMMPGMDGYEVCQFVRSDPNLAQVPIIMITALSDRSHLLKSLNAGADDFLTKPVNLFELKARVRTITRLDRYRRLLEEKNQRQQVEEALRESEAHLKESNLALADRVTELEALQKTSVAMASTLETESLLQLIVEQASELVNASSCSILLLDEETEDLVFHAAVDPIIGMRVPRGKGIVGRALRKEVPQKVHDVSQDPDYYPFISEKIKVPTLSELAIPLMVGNSPIGVLAAVNKRESFFTEHDSNLLVTLASHAAIAFENARLYEKAQEEIAVRRQAEEKLRHYAQQVVTAQEEERGRLSRELHDEAGQALTALKIGLELLQEDIPPEFESVHQGLSQAAALTGDTLEQLRLMAQGLHPPSLDTVGVSPTLEGFCHDFARRTQLEVEYQGVELPTLPEAFNISLYRLLQEALTNVARHARASCVFVSLSTNDDTIRLMVKDDGRGFDVEQMLGTATKPLGIGLLGMQERVELLGGELKIDSQPDQGTCLVATIPWEGIQ